MQRFLIFIRCCFIKFYLSLIYVSVEAAKTKGTISLEFVVIKKDQTETLIITIKDDGLYLKENENEHLFDSNREEVYLFIISIENIKNILEEYGGSLSTTFINEGRIVEIALLNNKTYEEAGHDVIPLKR